jgi:ABC-type bacteriocin/lantibiotic exporter with double-glycine peptidase domain
MYLEKKKKELLALSIITLIICTLFWAYPQRYQYFYPLLHTVPYHIQDNPFYCGEACIQMVLEFYGVQPLPSQNEIAIETNFSQNTTYAEYMEKPFIIRNFQVSINWTQNFDWAYNNLIQAITTRPVIILITWDNGDGHYLVVIQGNDKGISYHDPLNGKNKQMDKELLRALWLTNCIKYPPQPSCWILVVSR